MNSNQKSNLVKKILYSLVIFMSSLILLLSVAGIIAVWLVERPMADAAVTGLRIVENKTRTVQEYIGTVDQTLARLETQATDFRDASQQLSQNVTDKGLVMVLLPEEKEQQLTGTADSIRNSVINIRNSITNWLDLYRSLKRIPFVNLPGLSNEQMEKIDDTATQIQELATTIRTEIANIRSGVSGAIDKVEATVNLLTEEIQRVREALARVDSDLAALEALSIRLQQVIPGILLAAAIFLTLIFAFLIYSQVEVIRIYIQRWRGLGQPQEILPAESLEPPAPESEEQPQI